MGLVLLSEDIIVRTIGTKDIQQPSFARDVLLSIDANNLQLVRVNEVPELGKKLTLVWSFGAWDQPNLL
jgi:hypothetical protein